MPPPRHPLAIILITSIAFFCTACEKPPAKPSVPIGATVTVHWSGPPSELRGRTFAPANEAAYAELNQMLATAARDTRNAKWEAFGWMTWTGGEAHVMIDQQSRIIINEHKSYFLLNTTLDQFQQWLANHCRLIETGAG